MVVDALNAGVDMLVTSNKRTDNFEDRCVACKQSFSHWLTPPMVTVDRFFRVWFLAWIPLSLVRKLLR